MGKDRTLEIIKTEIERRKNKAETLRERNICIDILSFLSTLESEHLADTHKTSPKDLEEAAKKFVGYDMDCDEQRDYEIGIASFMAGAKWQKEQMMDEWLKDRDGCFWDGVAEGKKAMKEQMMEEAVAEVEVGMRGDPIEIILDKYVQRAMGIFPGDKVRIIIVKED